MSLRVARQVGLLLGRKREGANGESGDGEYGSAKAHGRVPPWTSYGLYRAGEPPATLQRGAKPIARWPDPVAPLPPRTRPTAREKRPVRLGGEGVGGGQLPRDAHGRSRHRPNDGARQRTGKPPDPDSPDRPRNQRPGSRSWPRPFPPPSGSAGRAPQRARPARRSTRARQPRGTAGVPRVWRVISRVTGGDLASPPIASLRSPPGGAFDSCPHSVHVCEPASVERRERMKDARRRPSPSQRFQRAPGRALRRRGARRHRARRLLRGQALSDGRDRAVRYGEKNRPSRTHGVLEAHRRDQAEPARDRARLPGTPGGHNSRRAGEIEVPARPCARARPRR
jgi:hypothetical protein